MKLNHSKCNADHPWMREDGDASDKPLDIAVLSRMKQFRAMNKLKKVALKVSVSFINFISIIFMDWNEVRANEILGCGHAAGRAHVMRLEMCQHHQSCFCN